MIAGEALIVGAAHLKKNLDEYDRSMVRNMNTAFRVVGYRLKNKLQKEIRAGAPGGSKFSPLTVIASKWFHKRRKSSALARLAFGVRYHIPNTPTPILQVGFVSPITVAEQLKMGRSGVKFGKYKGSPVGAITHKSWRWLAELHQRGFKKNVTDAMRFSLYRRADEVRGTEREYLKIKESTTKFETDPRPIINPFWEDSRRDTIRDIRVNWERKMRGERI